jgi:hypothetical protein
LVAKLVERDELERRGDRDAGVVDETVQPRADSSRRSRDLLRVGDVEPKRLDVPAA